MAPGGIFLTDDDAVAEYIESLDWFKDGIIVKLSHEKLGKLMASAPKEEDKVVQGAVGSVPAGKARVEAPEAPEEQEPEAPRAARAPRRIPAAA